MPLRPVACSMSAGVSDGRAATRCVASAISAIVPRAISEPSVQRRHTSPERLDVLPDLRVFLPLLVVERAGGGRELEIFLQIAERGREVLEVIREQAAVAQLVGRGWIDGQQELG